MVDLRRRKHLRRFGDATKTEERRSLAGEPHDRSIRLAAKASLRYPPVRLNPSQIEAVGRGFEKIIPKIKLRIFACSILPDHVHLVIDRHPDPIEEIIGYLKRAATRELNRAGLNPLADYQTESGEVPSIWVRGGWNRYLNAADEIIGAVAYAKHNLIGARMRPQSWPFVSDYP